MLELLRREGVYLWYYFTVQLEQIAGYWVLGMVLGSAVSVFAKDAIHRAFASLGESGWAWRESWRPAPWASPLPSACTAPSRWRRPFPRGECGTTGWRPS